MNTNMTVNLDWKFVAALGAAISGIIFTSKMHPQTVEKVSVQAIDAVRDTEIAINGRS